MAFQWWLDGQMQPITTAEQLRGYCVENGIPTREFPDGRVKVLDLTKIPGAARDGFDESGFLREVSE